VARGWLIRKRSESDHRSSRLHLSGEGEELLDRIERAKLFSSESLGDPLDVLDFEERNAFRTALEKVEARARELFGAKWE
jgi:DNA-binding MarR family transcriptional regulator